MTQIDLKTKILANHLKSEGNYWKKQLHSIESMTSFVCDFTSNKYDESDKQYSSCKFTLDKELSNVIFQLSKGNHDRLHVVLTSTVLCLLYNYSGNKNISVGIPVKNDIPVSNRVNYVLPICVCIEEFVTLRNFLSIVRNSIIDAINNQNYPIDLILQEINDIDNLNKNHLYDTIVSLDHIHDLEYISSSRCSLIFNFNINNLEINCEILYLSNRYDIETITRIENNFVYHISQILKELDKKLIDTEFICSKEKEVLLYEFNDTKADYPQDKTIHQLFEEQVEKTPDNIALVFGEYNISYRELKNRANRISSFLINKGIESDNIVALLFEPSIEMIITILGVLRSGAAYLPIDISTPVDRINYMFFDSSAMFLIAKNDAMTKNEFSYNNVITYDDIIKNNYSVTLNKNFLINSIAYIIYTSGTTGNPKGVIIEHRSLVEFAVWAVNEFRHRINYKVLLSNSYSFDGAIQQIFPPLISGGCLYIIEKEIRLDIPKYIFFLQSNKINNIDEVPAIMREMVNAIHFGINEELLPSLTCISLGSEFVPIDIIIKCKKYLNGSGEIINAYGPAEATVETTTYNYNVNNNSLLSLIGKPKSNTKVYIVNEFNHLMPIGVCGEICISGICLARGYLNKPLITDERFIKNPFEVNEIMYKTGDLGRWLQDGNIEFLGRIDHQVKIRGFRIELGEIESALLKIDGIKETVVIAKDDLNGQKYLVVYFVLDKNMDTSYIRSELSKSLPDYMIPSYFVQLESLPLNQNGKIDRKALPEPEVQVKEYLAPRNEIESKLVSIWSEVLNLSEDKISIDANFFELGGNSIKIINLNSKIKLKIQINIKVTDLFRFVTITSQAAFIIGDTDKFKETMGHSIDNAVSVMEETMLMFKD